MYMYVHVYMCQSLIEKSAVCQRVRERTAVGHRVGRCSKEDHCGLGGVKRVPLWATGWDGVVKGTTMS